MPVLQIRDKDGKFIPIPAVKGNDGKSAYEQAKEGGYTGTEEEFIAFLNGLLNPVAVASDDPSHDTDYNNPHKVTKEQVGLGNVDNTSDADKPVSDAQATAIADAKKAGTDAQTNLNTHLNDTAKHVITDEDGGVALGDYRLMDANGVIPADRLPSTFNIQSGSYTGTGTFGESNKNTLTFSFVPKIVFISAVENVDAAFHSAMPIIQGCATARIHFRVDASSDRCYSDCIYLTWNDKTLSWYSTNQTYKASMQLNVSGVTYKYVAIG